VAFERAERFHRRLAFREAAPVVGAARGVTAELDDRHDVQHPVDTPVPDPGEPVAALITGGRFKRAVPFQDAKCAAVRNRRMSPISPINRAAPDGPIPCRSVNVLP
jgi:hypothetical protein